MYDQRDRRLHFARHLLGPLLAEFGRRLQLYSAGHPRSGTVALYCARGGLRLRVIHERWLQRMALAGNLRHENFMISRLLATTVALHDAPAAARESLAREFHGQPLGALARALLPAPPDPELADELGALWLAAADAEGVDRLLFGRHRVGERIRNHAAEQSDLFTEYLGELRRDCERLVLVDSGLFGRTQMLLAAARPQFDWHGAYLARSNYRREPAPHFRNATGLIVEHDAFSFFVPETALLRYWHLVEAVIEPATPSVRQLLRSSNGRVASNLDSVDWGTAVTDDGNPFFAGVIEYIDRLRPEDLAFSRSRFRNAMRELQRRILTPRAAGLADMDVGRRSADFGRDDDHPVLHHGATGGLRIRHRRIRESLWPEGQVALELGVAGEALLRHRFRFGRLFNALAYLLRRH